MKSIGQTTWLIPDAYWPQFSNGKFPSHESVCLLNTGDKDATVALTLYFEDRDPMTGFTVTCGAKRTNHARLDKLKDKNGKTVPQGVPYAILVESNIPIVVQYSRMDTTQPEMALMTCVGYAAS